VSFDKISYNNLLSVKPQVLVSISYSRFSK